VDTQTRHALKSNSFVEAAASSVEWLSGHRAGALRWVIGAGIVLVVAIGALIGCNLRSVSADAALGAAMDVYTSPLAEPGVPATDGTYATAADRSRAANQKFTAVAQKYGWLAAGKKAHYLVGITDEELGQNGSAESELKIAAGSWNHNVANLAKLALAGLYRQTSRDAQAVEQYNAIAAKPSETVSAAVAQLNLADLYAAEGKQDQARELWAKVKDADKEGAAGSIAAEKLEAK